jgi:exopolyphosphatase/guanosine-5'-triphosphate,3'-diphosphate pyrophosphatase
MIDTSKYPAPIAIIDIGSNSVRLVVFESPYIGERPIFNEKVQCSLGEDLDKTGRLSETAKRRTTQTLAGFLALCSAMNIGTIIPIATAALRDAEDGREFIAEIRTQMGLDITIISGEDEARYSGLGVLAAFPQAKGVAGDLGGGSLELATIKDGGVADTISMPIGVLRILGKGKDGERYLEQHLASISPAYMKQPAFYIIGGTWRALTYAYIMTHNKRVPGIHGFRMKAEPLAEFAKEIAGKTGDELIERYHFEHSRAELLPAAAMIMHKLLPLLQVKTVIVSTGGLRDGLLRSHLEGEL